MIDDNNSSNTLEDLFFSLLFNKFMILYLILSFVIFSITIILALTNSEVVEFVIPITQNIIFYTIFSLFIPGVILMAFEEYEKYKKKRNKKIGSTISVIVAGTGILTFFSGFIISMNIIYSKFELQIIFFREDPTLTLLWFIEFVIGGFAMFILIALIIIRGTQGEIYSSFLEN
ncbi:MAG: hypothetical protein ACW98D_19785 [Promethearchaeota archaeon]